MPFNLFLTFILCCIAFSSSAQTDTTVKNSGAEIFERIMKSAQDYKPDTSAAPDDKITAKIKELRDLRGGFNISEAINFKIEEDRQKGEIPKEELDKISVFFNSGNGKRWLDNAITWIYRNHFTYQELKQLVRFYKTSAGQKMANDFPVIMIQSLRAGEMIKEWGGGD